MNAVVLVAGAVLALAVGWIVMQCVPASRAIRMRNALLLRRGAEAAFEWTPERVPADFTVEHARAVPVIEEAVFNAGIDGIALDWDRALALVTLLVRNAKRDRPIRADLVTTWRGVMDGGGYCADYVRVYLAASRAANLFCRQWAFSFDGFGGHGHTVVEVYDRQRAAWAFIDVHNNVYAVRVGLEQPIDAVTLRREIAESTGTVEFRRAGEGRLGWSHFDKLVEYYRRGSREWYMWWGNDVITRDRGSRWSYRFGSALARLPAIVAFVTPENEAAVRRMEGIRRRARVALAAGSAALMVLLVVFLRAKAGVHG